MEKRTSTQAAERGLLLILVLFRLATLCQADVGAVFGWEDVRFPVVYVLLTLAVNVFSFALMYFIWRSQKARSIWWSAADVVVSASALIIQAHLIAPEWMVGSWIGWAPGLVTCTSATLGVLVPSLAWVTFGSAFLMVTYLVTLTTIGHSPVPTVGINGVMYVGFTLLLYVLSRYWRALAQRSDADRAAAVAATKAAELDRYRLLVHDPATVLRMLGNPDTPAQLLPALREQALAEASRMRAYLDDRPETSTTPETTTLECATQAALSSFPDLPIESSTLLARDVQLDEADALAIQRALTTLLHNVRLHARASQVVVHADAFDGQWELSVSDDGIGFALTESGLGYGLGEQVVESMRRIGAHVDISSAPGEGTRVVITAPDTLTSAH